MFFLKKKYIYTYIHQTPVPQAVSDIRSIFKFNEFEISLPLPRLVVIPWLKNPLTKKEYLDSFPRVLVLYEMQTALPRVWIQVDVYISYDNKY